MPPRATASLHKQDRQTPEEVAELLRDFLGEHTDAALAEDGKVLFEMSSAEYELSTSHGHCTLHVWSAEGNTVRRVAAATKQGNILRLSTLRLGQARTKMLELLPARSTRTPSTRDTTRLRYLRLLEDVITRAFAEWKPQGFRTAMDLERSFGPAYARGSVVRGNQAWAVIGVSEHESQATVDGILTLGILWLHHCRESAGGRRLYRGLKVIVPHGMALITQSRMAWLNDSAAAWELYELNEKGRTLTPLDLDDTGNLRTRLIHRPDESAAKERFAEAAKQVLALIPQGEDHRVEQRLRSSTELAFLLHGLEFARARVSHAPNSFQRKTEVFFGAGEQETLLVEGNRQQLAVYIADLFGRRRANLRVVDYTKRGHTPARRIGSSTAQPAHSRLGGNDSFSNEGGAQSPAGPALPRLARALAGVGAAVGLSATNKRAGVEREHRGTAQMFFTRPA